MRGHMQRARAQEKGEKINPSEFWQVDEPTLQEKLVLDLANAIEKAFHRGSVSTSWASQDEAIAYYNKHGFYKTLDRLVELGGVK